MHEKREKSWKARGLAGWVILAAVCCVAADDPPQPPVKGRPAAFSGIVGAVKVTASAAPLEVQVESPITYKLRLQGPPGLQTLPVPDLRKVRGFDPNFAIRFLADRWLPQEKTREFDFELRPKKSALDAIPPFSFVFWVPGSVPPEAGYQTRYTESIPIKVKARPATPVQSLPIETPVQARQEPELAFDFSADVLDTPKPAWRFSLGQVALIALLPPVLVCFRFRNRWRSRRWVSGECTQTLALARQLATVEPQVPEADENARGILDANRGILLGTRGGGLHGADCQCRELLDSGRAYLYGGPPRTLLNQLVKEARRFADREKEGKR